MKYHNKHLFIAKFSELWPIIFSEMRVFANYLTQIKFSIPKSI
jgi:hypothetical protein